MAGRRVEVGPFGGQVGQGGILEELCRFHGTAAGLARACADLEVSTRSAIEQSQAVQKDLWALVSELRQLTEESARTTRRLVEAVELFASKVDAMTALAERGS